MDDLKAYSSDDDDEEVEEGLAQPFFNAADIYSQNYQFHTNHMVAAFLYLPWAPSLAAVNALKRTSHRAIRELKEKHPQQSAHYDWHYVGAPRATTLGKFSITNKHNLSHFHVTLGGNVKGDARAINLFVANLRNAVQKLPIDAALMEGDEVQRRVNLVLGIGSRASAKVVLKFEDALTVFRNASTGNVFIAGVLRRDGAQGRFLNGLHNVLNENRQLLGLGSAARPNWHISFVVGESKGGRAGHRAVRHDTMLGTLALSEPVMDEVSVAVDRVVVSIQGASRQQVEIKLRA